MTLKFIHIPFARLVATGRRTGKTIRRPERTSPPTVGASVTTRFAAAVGGWLRTCSGACRTVRRASAALCLWGGLVLAGVPVRAADFVHDTCVFDSCCSTFLLVGRLVLNDPLSPTFQESNVDGTPVSTAPDVVVVTDRSLNINQLEANELLRRLRRVQRDLYASGGFDEAAERRKLAAQLRAFGDTADYVPLVYATIHTEYGGDITRYVDDLFRRSTMTNRRRMKRVARWPRKKRLQSDMGFQLSLSKQLYRAWEQMDRPTQLIGHFVIPNQWKK